MKTYLRLLSYAKPYARFAVPYLIFAVLAVVFGIVNFTLLIPLLNILFNNVSATAVSTKPLFHFSLNYFTDLFNYYFTTFITTNGKFGALLYVCGVVGLFTLGANLFRYMSQRVLADMRANVLQRIRSALFERFSTLPLPYYHQHRKGDLISMMSTDMNEVENSVVSTFQVVFREPLMIVGYFVALFLLSAQLTFFTLLYLPVSILVIGTISRILRKEAKQSQGLLGELISVTEETLGGIKVVKGFNAEQQVQQQFGKFNNRLSESVRRYFFRRELASPFSEFVGVAVVLGILVYGGKMVLSNDASLSASEFITYLILYSQVLVPAKNLVNALGAIQRGIAAGDRIFSVLDVPAEAIDEGEVDVKKFDDAVRFDSVYFSYGTKDVLENISFELRRGKIVALVGPSGSGKTTVSDLLPRFYDVTRGVITLDNVNLRNIKPASLRKLMGIVTQEPVLFHDTIYNNIAFGTDGATQEKVKAAARVANAHEFISQSDNGYQTVIGDRGVKLSGGQRQRISIARAVLKNPPLLILDEATSALDTESERLVQDALYKLMQNRTTLVIAHRLSTIQSADEILVLQNGKIIERGSHNALVEQKGFYKKLVDLQLT